MVVEIDFNYHIRSDQRNNHDRRRERRMKLSKTINISSGGEGGGLDRHEMAIFQCKEKKIYLVFLR